MAELNMENVEELVKKLNSTLEEFAEENNLEEILLGNIKFDSIKGEVNAKIKIIDKQNEEEKIKMFEISSMIIGLKPDLYNKKFSEAGKTFTIKEIKKQNRKYPVIALDENGVRYKFATLFINEKFLDL